jgi:hypothetical protein
MCANEPSGDFLNPPEESWRLRVQRGRRLGGGMLGGRRVGLSR